MDMRPGKTSPDYIIEAGKMDRNGKTWTYKELCDLLKDDPSSKEQLERFAMLTSRTVDSVGSQRTKLLRMIWSKHIHFDGERIVPGRYGDRKLWPLTLTA
jgi:lambda repressor-like predicted transcriptional regulator